VSIVGSELGQTFVMAADGENLSRIEVQPKHQTPCN
jgi:hypothetical protein